jgi:hypothetical protein
LTLTLDLGLGGMKIDTSNRLPKGQFLNFKLVLRADSIWPKGRIAYSKVHLGNRNLSGVQFVELSSEDCISLQKCLAFQEELPKPRGMLSVDKRKEDAKAIIKEDKSQGQEGSLFHLGS